MISNHLYGLQRAHFALTLVDGTDGALLGVWGPYSSEEEAAKALEELQLWPIDGVWDVIRLKNFPAPVPPPSATPRSSPEVVHTDFYARDRDAA